MGTAIDALNRAFHDSISILGADVLFVSRMTWVDRTITEMDINKRNAAPISRSEQARQVEQQMTWRRPWRRSWT